MSPGTAAFVLTLSPSLPQRLGKENEQAALRAASNERQLDGNSTCSLCRGPRFEHPRGYSRPLATAPGGSLPSSGLFRHRALTYM